MYVCVCVHACINSFLPEFIIPTKPLNAEDRMMAPGKYPKRARNATSSAFVWPKL